MTSFPYDLNHPDKSYSLPDPYKEISGLSPLEGNNCLAFVQDEAVQIHLFDLASGTITELAKHGDGERDVWHIKPLAQLAGEDLIDLRCLGEQSHLEDNA